MTLGQFCRGYLAEVFAVEGYTLSEAQRDPVVFPAYQVDIGREARTAEDQGESVEFTMTIDYAVRAWVSVSVDGGTLDNAMDDAAETFRLLLDGWQQSDAVGVHATEYYSATVENVTGGEILRWPEDAIGRGSIVINGTLILNYMRSY